MRDRIVDSAGVFHQGAARPCRPSERSSADDRQRQPSAPTGARARRGAGVAGAILAAIVAGVALACWLPSALAASTGPPQVATGGVSHVRGSTAELEGTVYPHGLPTTYFFQYGPTTAYGSSTPPAVLPAATTRIKVGQITGGLQPGYHYRIVAYNGASNGLARVGKDRIFGSKSRKVKFQLPKSLQPIPYKHAFELSGTVSGIGSAGLGLVLQETPFPYLSEFRTVTRAGDHERQRRLQLPPVLAADERRVPDHHHRAAAAVQRRDQAAGDPGRGRCTCATAPPPGSCACTGRSRRRSPAPTC